MLNDLSVKLREDFYEEHGAYVQSPEGEVLFADGAVDQNDITGLGRLIPPPEDDYELAKNICRYWLLLAQATEQHFTNFKDWLAGHGRREAAWATLYTEEEQLKHLAYLQQQAKRARAKYY